MNSSSSNFEGKGFCIIRNRKRRDLFPRNINRNLNAYSADMMLGLEQGYLCYVEKMRFEAKFKIDSMLPDARDFITSCPREVIVLYLE